MAGKPATPVLAGGARKPKHVPQRTCVGCRTVLAKRTLTRVVRQPEGIFIDPSGKMNGRGAYVHDRRSCWEQSLKGALANALKVSLTAEDRQRLANYMASLPEESAVTPQGKNDAGAQA
jgi:predicted RNA-binding protein YlxR (DUF448 family)